MTRFAQAVARTGHGHLRKSRTCLGRVALAALVVAAVGGAGRSASAQAITYTVNVTMSGSLGGNAFTNAATTLVTTADISNITFSVIGGFPIYQVPGTTTFDIAGVGSGTFNGGNQFGAFWEDLTSVIPGAAAVGIVDLTQLSAIGGVFTSVTPPYDLSTARTFSGAGVSGGGTFSTTLGNLVLTGSSVSGPGTFVAAVPEPSSLLLGGALGGLALARQVRVMRKRRDAAA